MAPVMRTSPLPLLLAVVVVVAGFLWEGRHGFSLYDEGFLWYGAQGVLRGEVPIRDFMAYDPGRYYWSAAVMRLVGDEGIMALRTAAAAFQAVGLYVALRLVAPGHGTPLARAAFLTLAASVLAAWMVPRHKLFDITFSILLTATLAWLIALPGRRRWFAAGACVGVAAIFGRNHGLYGLVGLLGIAAWLASDRIGSTTAIRGLAAAALGVAVGYAPLVAWVALVPGLAPAFLEGIRFYFELGATNIALPVPWPWRVDFAALPAAEAARQAVVGVFFIALPLFAALALGVAAARRRRGAQVPPVLVASGVMAIPYAHYAYSRAEIYHLALGIFPLLVGSLALIWRERPGLRWALASLLAGATMFAAHPTHPGWHCRYGGPCVEVEVSGSKLRADPGTAADIAILRKFGADDGSSAGPVLVTPFWPGAYPLLGRRAPVWEIYALVPRSAAFEEREIERLRHALVSGVAVLDVGLDGRDDMRFRNTHPRTHAYIESNFQRMPPTGNPALHLYRAKTSIP